MTIRVRSLTDTQERQAAIPALSDLRIRVFREWPYLYEGTADYEAEYLAEFIDAPGAVLVVEDDPHLRALRHPLPLRRRRMRRRCARPSSSR